MSALNILSWLAVSIGITGTWIAGKSRRGWLVGAVSSTLWIVYDIDRAIWAGALAGVIAVFISIRNFRIGNDN